MKLDVCGFMHYVYRLIIKIIMIIIILERKKIENKKLIKKRRIPRSSVFPVQAAPFFANQTPEEETATE